MKNESDRVAVVVTENKKEMSFRQRIFQSIKPFGFLLMWAYLLCCFYVAVGIILFPSWWKRALFDLKVFDPHFLRFAFYYVADLLSSGHPLGFVFPTVIVFSIGFFIFYLGKFGRRRAISTLPRPKVRTLVFASLICTAMLLSLRFTNAPYRTPDEINAIQTKLDKMRTELESPFESPLFASIWKPQISPPQSGYYLYLDVPRIRSAYTSAQKELEVASQTTRNERERRLGVEAIAANLKVDASGKVIEEASITKMPPATTPERQAKHLIEWCSGDSISITAEGQKATVQIQRAVQILEKAGIELTKDQEDLATRHVTETTAKGLERKGNVMTYSGSVTIVKNGKEFSLSFRSTNSAHVEYSAKLEEQYVDSLIREELAKTNAIALRVRMLAGEMLRTSDGTNYNIKLLPLVVW